MAEEAQVIVDVIFKIYGDSIPVHKPGFISRIVGSYKARAKSIAKGLAEAEKIKNGQKKVKSFEQAIKDL